MSQNSLKIYGVTVHDTGTYACEVEANTDDQFKIHHFLQVLGNSINGLMVMSILDYISESPTIEGNSEEKRLTVRAGTTISLDCRANGHPTPSITWKKLEPGR